MKTISNIPFPVSAKWNEYQTVLYSNQTSFTNEDGETMYEADMTIVGEMPVIEVKQSVIPGFILCSISDYFKINKKLSDLKSYQIGKATERVSGVNPRAAKTNVQIDEEGNESYEAKIVFKVSSQNLIDYPEIFEGFEVVQNFVPVDAPLDFVELMNIDSDTMLWIAQHCIRLHVSFDGLVVSLPLAYLDAVPEDVIKAMNDLGVTVIFE
jgi:hypothetical protein